VASPTGNEVVEATETFVEDEEPPEDAVHPLEWRVRIS
jgi:hypothetical protein